MYLGHVSFSYKNYVDVNAIVNMIFHKTLIVMLIFSWKYFISLRDSKFITSFAKWSYIYIYISKLLI